MKVIFGLGNIGKRFESTRHNAGFQFVEYLLDKMDVCETKLEKHRGLIVKQDIKRVSVLIVKPITMMNLSGDCVREVVNFYKISLEDILVVHDDLDIPIGGYKMQLGKGPKGHNGLIDIEKKLGASNFLRLRLGIENRTDLRFAGEDYVLEKFTNEENKSMRETFPFAWDMVLKSFILSENTTGRGN